MSVRNTLVADTSVLYAGLDPQDDEHAACRDLLLSGPPVAFPALLLGEVDWLGRSRGKPRAGSHLLASVIDDSVLAVDLDLNDWRRVHELVDRYADLPLSVFDASVVAVAERLEEPAIATLDHRHFSVVRPRHVRAFALLP